MRVGPINKKAKGTVRDNVYHIAARVEEDKKNEDNKLGQTHYPIHSTQARGGKLEGGKCEERQRLTIVMLQTFF